jgi:ribitol 2-dehydrogenase
MSPQSITGKSIFITGASSGIGKATAKLLAANGGRLTLAARSFEKLQLLAREIDAFPVACDVTSLDSVKRAIEAALEQYGKIDVLFANAGIYLSGDVADGSPEAWSQLIDVNVKGVMNSVHAVLPAMLQHGNGDISVCSSISGHQAIHWEPVYSASKHAVQSFVHGLRRQLLHRGIRVGAVAPGMVLNELWGIQDETEIARRVELGEGLRSEDVAEAVLFILTRPRNVTVRDLVMLPRVQDL